MRIIKLGKKYYCLIKQGFTIDSAKDAYMDKAKVIKCSLAGEYTETIFKNVFYNAIDLKSDYNDFYVEEYSDFETFLYQKELFSKKEIIELHIEEDKTLIRIDMNTNSYNASTLFEYEDGFINIFNQMLEGIDE